MRFSWDGDGESNERRWPWLLALVATLLTLGSIANAQEVPFRHFLTDLVPGNYDVFVSTGCDTDSVRVMGFTVADSTWVPDETHPDGGSWIPSDGTATFVTEEGVHGCWRIWPREDPLPPDMLVWMTPEHATFPTVAFLTIESVAIEDELPQTVWGGMIVFEEPGMAVMPKIAGRWVYNARFLWADGFNLGEMEHKTTFTW